MQDVIAAIALGSNLGDRRDRIASGLRAIAALRGVSLIAASELFETAPVGPVAQEAFLNAAALIRTGLPPRDLLSELLGIEQAHGRDRAAGERWGPRTLDLDLLLYGDLVIDEPGLTIPHPRLHERAFVLDPLVLLAPDLIVPTLGRTIRELHADLHRLRSAPA